MRRGFVRGVIVGGCAIVIGACSSASSIDGAPGDSDGAAPGDGSTKGGDGSTTGGDGASDATIDATTMDSAGGSGDATMDSSSTGSGDASNDASADASSDAASPSDGATFDGTFDAGVDAEVDTGVDAGMDAGPPGVRYVGRWDWSTPSAPVIEWPGARIIARFDGTQVSATFTDTPVQATQGWWDVIVDGTLGTPLAMTPGTGKYALATGLAPGVHTIELWRRTEALVSWTKFGGFDFGGGTLLPPPAAPLRKIEFIGDSGSDGYGIDGKGPNCSFTAATQNEHEAYPALMSQMLEADAHDLAFSGKGVYWDYDRANPTHYGDLYPRTRPLVDTSTWDYSAFVPDVVFVNEGGNDWDIPNPGDPPPPVDKFTAAYDALIAQVRAAHPNAHIFCAVGPSLNDDYPVGYNAYTNVTTILKGIVAARTNGGDAKIHYFEFTRSLDTDLTGCEYHPNPQKHQNMAVEAATYVKNVMGW